MPKFKNLMKSIFDEDIDVDQEEMEEEKEEPKKVEEPAPQPMVVKPEAPAEPKKTSGATTCATTRSDFFSGCCFGSCT